MLNAVEMFTNVDDMENDELFADALSGGVPSATFARLAQSVSEAQSVSVIGVYKSQAEESINKI